MPKAPTNTSKTPARAREASDKPTIILMHGFRGNHYGVTNTAKNLEKKGFRVLTPDIPPATALEDNLRSGEKPVCDSVSSDSPAYADGILADLPKAFFTKDGYADWVADFIDRNRLKKPIIVGHSMGSIIAAAVAEKYPDKIADKIVFMAPISVHPPKLITNLSPLAFILPMKLISFLSTNFLIINRDNYKEALKFTNACAAHVTSRRSLFRAARFSTAYAISDFTFKKDALFLAGEVDRLNGFKPTAALAKSHNAKHEIIKHTGHLINYEAPAEVATRIANFLKDDPKESSDKSTKTSAKKPIKTSKKEHQNG